MLSHTTSIGAAMCVLDHGFAGTGIRYEPGANFIIGKNIIYDACIERREIVLTFSWWEYLPLNGEGVARDRENCLYYHNNRDIYINKCDNNMLLFESFVVIGDKWQEFPIRRRDRWLNRSREIICNEYFLRRIGIRVGVRHR